MVVIQRFARSFIAFSPASLLKRRLLVFPAFSLEDGR